MSQARWHTLARETAGIVPAIRPKNASFPPKTGPGTQHAWGPVMRLPFTLSSLGLLSSLLLALPACSGPAPDATNPGGDGGTGKTTTNPRSPQRNVNPIAPAADIATLVSGNTTFATALHTHLAAQAGNLFYSPYTISLNMAEVDASGSQPTVATALHFTLPPAKLNPAFDALDLDLTSLEGKTSTGQGDQFLEASAAWGTLATPGGAVSTLEQYYGADVLTGKDPGAAVQTWEGASSPGPELPVALIGACDGFIASLVNFDAAWETAFDPSATQPGTFTRAGGSTVSVPIMSQEVVLSVHAGGATPAVEIPYDGGRLSMLVVIPSDLTLFEASLDPSAIDAIEHSLSPANVQLGLPKFSFTAGWSVLPVLEKMGLALGGGGEWNVSHVAEIKVSETGTQASATSATSHSPSAAAPATQFQVDRPFVFFIRDTKTGTVLFIGRIVDPTVTHG